MPNPSALDLSSKDDVIVFQDPRAVQVPDLLREMGEHLRRLRELSHLQTSSALSASTPYEGIPRVFAKQVFLFETRMLGLQRPAVVLTSTLLAPHPPTAAAPTLVVILFIGTPVPSPGELRFKNNLRATLVTREVGLKLLSAKTPQVLKKVLMAIDPCQLGTLRDKA